MRHFNKHLALLLSATAMAANASPPVTEQDLIGTYRLVSATRTILATGQIEHSFGPTPSGYITYGADHRMMVLIVNSDRPKASFDEMDDATRARLFDSMAAYAGTYELDGERITHRIDISWNGWLTGKDQVRTVRKEGNRLIYTTAPSPAPTDGKVSTGELVWERISATGAEPAGPAAIK
jgi:hypothetical protein